MVRGKSNGPGRPKKTRLGKKKKRNVIHHTLAHVRGIGDYPQSHQRVRAIDPRVSGAGILGARIKDRQHQGHTVPRLHSTLGTQAGSGKGVSAGTQTGSKTSTTTGTQSGKGLNSHRFRNVKVQTAATTGPEKRDASHQFGTSLEAVNIGREGPKFPSSGADRPRYNPNAQRGPKFPAMPMGERPYYNPNPQREEKMLDAPEKMQGIVRHKQQGPKKMQIDSKGYVAKEVRKIDARDNMGNEIVSAGDVVKNDKPKPAPKPAAARQAMPEFKANDAGPAPRKRPDKKKEERRQERRENARPKPRKAPRREATAEDEAHHEAEIQRKTHADKAAGRKEAIRRLREDRAERRKGNITVEREAHKKQHHPSASANIPNHQAGPSEHRHHHTGHKKMHDDDFSTFL